MEVDARFGGASLAQVAELLGRTEEEVATEATRLVGDGAASRGWLRADAVDGLTAGLPAVRPLSEAEPLILSAFRQAHESLKAEWTEMAVPVLKNRLLQLTTNSFRESDYGSPNIWHFVTRFPDLLLTEGQRPHERVRLLKYESVDPEERDRPAALDPAGMGRVRPDLWRAIFDYKSDETFVWDERTGRARVRKESDPDGFPVLPTLTSDEMKQLRAEFISVQENIDEDDVTRLDEWASRQGPTVALPRLYRGLWNAHLKSHAANKLRAFFLANNLDVPTDLVGQSSRPAEPQQDVERVRRLAHRYIDAMTAEELARLSIELAVVMRVPSNVDR